jgi:hypothetical protein
MAQLGANAHGEVLKPGRVPDCYVGLLLCAGDPDQAPSVLIVSPAAFLHPAVCQLDGTLLYELVTGHPDRDPGELVFLADLTVELRAWPTDTWAKVGDRPAGGRPRGHRRLEARRPARAAAGRADRRGGLGLGAAGHDLRARPAGRPARRPARPGVPAVAAPVQRPPARRPLPVAVDAWTAAVSAACRRVSAVDTGRPDTPAVSRFRLAAADSEAAAGVHCRSRPEALPGHSSVGDPSPCPVMAVAVSAADSAVQRVRTHRPAPAAWPDSAAACVRCHGRPPARPSVEQAPPCLDTRSARRTPKAADDQSADRSDSLPLPLLSLTAPGEGRRRRPSSAGRAQPDARRR